ncbi:hypothetical protein L218DRAFT_983327 [Marasmius fiardii PR-910]|nr:hypothetical protein L218DRAFT_983327 [Marasmius fiardii PR-910]
MNNKVAGCCILACHPSDTRPFFHVFIKLEILLQSVPEICGTLITLHIPSFSSELSFSAKLLGLCPVDRREAHPRCAHTDGPRVKGALYVKLSCSTYLPLGERVILGTRVNSRGYRKIVEMEDKTSHDLSYLRSISHYCPPEAGSPKSSKNPTSSQLMICLNLGHVFCVTPDNEIQRQSHPLPEFVRPIDPCGKSSSEKCRNYNANNLLLTTTEHQRSPNLGCWMQHSTTFPILDLPVELARSIFEVAAISDGPTLAVVSRQVRKWILPVIYEMVTLGSDDAALFLRTMGIFPSAFFAQHVKRLCLTASINPHDAARILECCTGVTSLACWVDFKDPHSPALSRLLAPLSLRRLSIELENFQRLPLAGRTWCNELSHLDLRMWEGQDPFIIPDLHHLPSLTHLAIYSGHWEIDSSTLERIMAKKVTIQVLCLVIDDEQEEYHERPILTDPRMVYMPRLEPVPDWEAPYRGLKDTWFYAEQMVARRMATVPT